MTTTNRQPGPTPKLALVTGAGVRLGQSIALTLASSGYDLLIHYHQSHDKATETASRVRDLGRQAHLIQADLGDPQSIETLVHQLTPICSGLDVLVNNAGVFYPTPTPASWLEHWDHFHNVNLKSPLTLIVKLLPLLQARQGCIVNIVDIWSRFPLKRFLAYSVAKSGLEALTRALALELAPSIRVNGVSPGAALPATGSEAPLEKMLSQVPLQRLGGAEAIASAVEFLCRSDYITGQILPVDGGRTINL